jgi:glycosyltransferase involved in cell wall biosynthesis
MAEAIDQVLSDDTIRTRLSKAGYKQIKKYSWKKMAQQTHDIYMKILDS